MGALVEEVADLAVQAGHVILEVYASAEVAVATKSDASPVTEADLRAEAVICAGLAELTPRLPVVAEERVHAGEIPAELGTTFWLVDPLDGTKEFLSRNGEFTVNIALIEQGAPVLGVVHTPVAGRTYFGVTNQEAARDQEVGSTSAGAGGIASVRDQSGSREIRVRSAIAEGVTVLVSRSHLDEETEHWLADVPVLERVSVGSSLKFCRIADGTADLYPRLGRTMEWDTAAGDAVVRAAGGSVRDLSGAWLRYGKPGFANPPFVAYGERVPKAA